MFAFTAASVDAAGEHIVTCSLGADALLLLFEPEAG
jgi:hypothetical protein